MVGTTLQNMVGVNFKQNPSLSERYFQYLSSSPVTCSTPLLLSSSNCLVAKVASSMDSLSALARLSTRHGFTRCSGRLFAMSHLSHDREEFYRQMELVLPSHTVIRTHAHPVSFASSILDYIDESPSLKERGVLSSPTQFSQLLVAVELEGGKIGWGIYTLSQYKESIARPGDGNPLPEFQLNFNRAELKLAEASQLLTDKQRSLVFPAQPTQAGGEPLLAVDVGAAPGGWTGYLSSLTTTPVSVIAIDPAELETSVAARNNVRHLRMKAEDVVGEKMSKAAHSLIGEGWRDKFRLLVCDANLDIRDCVRELVSPLCEALVPGGVLILTLKLGRRVGVEGVKRKEDSAREMLEAAGFCPSSVRFVWLFGNSRNERTIFASKS